MSTDDPRPPESDTRRGSFVASPDQDRWPPPAGDMDRHPSAARVKAIPPAVPAGLFLVALALVITALIVLGMVRPPGTRTATLAPPGSVFFASVFVEPSLGQRRALGELAERSQLDRLLPEGDLVAEALNRFLAPMGLDHARDVEPWLGREAGLSVMQGRRGSLQTIALLETTDPELADAHLAAAPLETADRRYRDVDYRVAREPSADLPDRWAFGVVDDFVVVANPRGAFEAAVDAALGASLADDPSFAAVLRPLPDDRLLAGYVSDPALATQLALPGVAGALASKLAGGRSAFTISLHAESDALVLASSEGDPVPLKADVLAALIQNFAVGR